MPTAWARSNARGIDTPTRNKNAGKTTKVFHFQTFRFSNNLIALGARAEGEEGVSHVVIDGEAGAMFKRAFKSEYSVPPVYRDSIYYDNAATLMLATLMAQKDLPVALDVNGAQIRDVLPCTSAITPECTHGAIAEPILPGVDGFRAAIRDIISSVPIDYIGASGPVDYDANRNVRQKVANYKVVNGQYVDQAVYDCVAGNDCPLVQ